MRVFISFAQPDEKAAAQLDGSVAVSQDRGVVQARLDVLSREEWSQLVDRDGAKADGFIFLIGTDFYENPQLQAEWRSFLRHDWDSTKPLVPVIVAPGTVSKDLPPFLRHRKAIHAATNFDAIVDDLRYLVEHPAESKDHTHDEEGRAQMRQRLREIEEFALALKEEARSGAKP